MIEGKLVTLRAQEMGDRDRLVRWFNDREVTRNLAQRYQISLLAEENWLSERTSKPLSYENAVFAIDTRDGVHIGNCGLHAKGPEERKADLGIAIGEKAYWSKGYGTDAISTLIAFGFDEMNLNRIDLNVYDFNERGMACYRKCGFVEEGRMREAHWGEGVYHDIVVMSVLREEFYARR